MIPAVTLFSDVNSRSRAGISSPYRITVGFGLFPEGYFRQFLLFSVSFSQFDRTGIPPPYWFIVGFGRKGNILDIPAHSHLSDSFGQLLLLPTGI